MTYNLQIAQELYNDWNNGCNDYSKDRMKQHAQDCQNFLTFLKMSFSELLRRKNISVIYYEKDLIDTLKFYKEKGVIE